MKYYIIKIASIFLLLSINVYLYAEIDKLDDLQPILSQYQRWLDFSKLSNILPNMQIECDTIEYCSIKKQYTLFLLIIHPDSDSIKILEYWKSANKNFLDNFNFSLDELLLIKIVNLLDEKINNVSIEVISKCFSFILQENEGKIVNIQSSECMFILTEQITIDKLKVDEVHERLLKIKKININNKIGYIEKFYLFLDNYFNVNERDIPIFQIGRTIIQVRFNSIEGEIIKNHNYKEQLDILFIFEELNQVVNIRCVAAGKYAAVSQRTADFIYQNMEKKYKIELEDYINILLKRIEKEFK